MPETSSIGPVEAFWRFRAWTVPITIVIGLLAGLFALASSGTNTATTTLFLTDPRGTPVFRDGSSTPTDLARYARQRAEFADSATVHQAVVDSIDAQRAELSADPDVDESRCPRQRRPSTRSTTWSRPEPPQAPTSASTAPPTPKRGHC